MANTYTLIASSTVGSAGASSFDFTSIPATFTDLKIMVSSRSDRAGEPVGDMQLRINNDSGANYGVIFFSGSGSATSSGNAGGQTSAAFHLQGGPTATRNVFCNNSFYIANYQSSTKKTISMDVATETNGSTIYQRLITHKHEGTSAITRITILDGNSATIQQYSTATLYGILKT